MPSLFVTRWRPDRTDGGAALRNLQNIHALAALGPVDVVSIGGTETESPVPHVRIWRHFEIEARPRQPGLWLVAPQAHPLISTHLHRGAAFALAEMTARGGYDVAVVEEIALAGYIPVLRRAGVPVVFDAHNVEGVLRQDIGPPAKGRARGMKARLLQQRLFAAEGRAIRAADVVWACSGEDSGALERLYSPRSRVAVVPNAVDVERYRAAAGEPGLPGGDPSAPVELLYMGTYSYPPNAAAALRLATEVLPALRARGARARVTVVGRDPTDAMRAAAAADPDVILTGAVDSVLPVLAAPRIVALPIEQGSGTRLKIIEALAAGRPVVSTAKGAEGIAVTDGRDIRIRETPERLADAALGLWRDPEAARRQGVAGQRLVEERYSWAVAARCIRESLAGVLANSAVGHSASRG